MAQAEKRFVTLYVHSWVQQYICLFFIYILFYWEKTWEHSSIFFHFFLHFIFAKRCFSMKKKRVNLKIFLCFLFYYVLFLVNRSKEQWEDEFSYYTEIVCSYVFMLLFLKNIFTVYYSQMHFIILCTMSRTRTRKHQLHLLIHFVWFICKCIFFLFLFHSSICTLLFLFLYNDNINCAYSWFKQNVIKNQHEINLNEIKM